MVIDKERVDAVPSEDKDGLGYLKICGKFAGVRPPAMTMLLPPPSRQTPLRAPEETVVASFSSGMIRVLAQLPSLFGTS